jgi:hypothetical protein
MARWLGKIDHRLRALWERIPEPERSRHEVRVLLRFTGSADFLKDLGAQAHSVAGDIASCTIVLGELPRIADAAQVTFVELAQILAQDWHA